MRDGGGRRLGLCLADKVGGGLGLLLLLVVVVNQGRAGGIDRKGGVQHEGRPGSGGVLRDEMADLDLRVKLVVVVAAGCVTGKNTVFNQFSSSIS